MPDLEPVFVELRRRMSLHEDVFRRSVNVTDANGVGAQALRASDPETETSYLLVGAPTEWYPDGLMFGAVMIGKRYVSYHHQGPGDVRRPRLARDLADRTDSRVRDQPWIG